MRAQTVRFDLVGARSLRIGRNGELAISTPVGTLRQRAPIAWQQIGAERRPVPVRFRLLGAHRFGFALGAHDLTRAVVIDPTLDWSGPLGGAGNDVGYDIAVDGTGAAYVSGTTTGAFPVANPIQAANGGGRDAFVAKIDPTGTALVYSTHLGGSADDYGFGVAVDRAGAAYVTGIAFSANFPIANALQPVRAGTTDAFVAKLDPAGTALVYSTYLGGTGTDFGVDIAVDGAGAAYVTGLTTGSFPGAGPIQPGFGGGTFDGFVAKLDPAGSALVYSTYLGGGAEDYGLGIAVDRAGAAYVTGYTFSTNFPTANPLQVTNNGGGNNSAFVAKVKPDGSALVYSTYLGGTGGAAAGRAIAVDNAGAAYVTGATGAAFPTADPLQPGFGGGGSDAFVAKLNPTGSALVYSTYLGGAGAENTHDALLTVGGALAVDCAGAVYLTGSTSGGFPTRNPLQSTPGAGIDAFVAKIPGSGGSCTENRPRRTAANRPRRTAAARTTGGAHPPLLPLHPRLGPQRLQRPRALLAPPAYGMVLPNGCCWV